MFYTALRSFWDRFLSLQVLLGGAIVVCALGLLALARACDHPSVPAHRLVVDLNSAPPAMLEMLPRLGPAVVGRIVGAREDSPFQSLEDLDLRVKGIGPATIAALRPHLRCEPSRP